MLQLLRDVWARVQDDLRTRAGEAAFDGWLSELRPLALERGVCYLEAKSRVVSDRVQRLFQPLIEECLTREIGTRISISLVAQAEAQPLDVIEVGPRRPVIDDNNRTAFLVLRALLEERALPSTMYYFHGGPGVGKTFLLRFWAQQSEPSPLDFPGSQLVKAFQACLRDQRVDGLREELSAPAPLMIDELHRIAGHHRIQRELLAVLKERQAAGHVVVMASRWHPNDIWNLDPKLRSFLMSGFVTAIEAPGPRARLTFLRALEGTRSRNGRSVEIEALARTVRGGFHDLRTAWAEQRSERAQSRPVFELINPRTVFQRVIARVAPAFGVTADDIIGPGQGRRVSLARQILSYLCVQEGLSRAEIGRFLGGRSRAAISYATKRVEQRMADDAELRARVEEFL